MKGVPLFGRALGKVKSFQMAVWGGFLPLLQPNNKLVNYNCHIVHTNEYWQQKGNNALVN